MEKVYAFTNENVTSYENLYNFKDARVLSVLGSGDQYFASVLYGAKNIELFDINRLAWDYFVLKRCAIMHLDYNDFYEYYFKRKASSRTYYNKLKDYLPIDVRTKLEEIMACRLLGDNFNIQRNIPKGDGSFIPYLNEERYKVLQERLNGSDLPQFYSENITDIPQDVNEKSYDIVLASNIFGWLKDEEGKTGLNINNWKKLLSKIDANEYQADYLWLADSELASDVKRKYFKRGFELSSIPSSRSSSFKNDRCDCVVSLKKEKKLRK